LKSSYKRSPVTQISISDHKGDSACGKSQIKIHGENTCKEILLYTGASFCKVDWANCLLCLTKLLQARPIVV